MREKRNGLRPITLISGKTKIEGYFHFMGQSGDSESGIGIVAIIEEENGELSEWPAYMIKFDDIESRDTI